MTIARHTPGLDNIEDQLEALQSMDLQGLRDCWKARFGVITKLRSPELLRLQIAWRIQTAHYGGLDGEVKRLPRAPIAKSLRANTEVGDQIFREWNGLPHRVEVVDGGFVYAGQTYKSLSHIARLITGSRWNGPRFFGLRQEEPDVA